MECFRVTAAMKKERAIMRKTIAFSLIFVLLVSTCGCGLMPPLSADARWQGQYDRGVRCVKEGDYEEAIFAFSAAIDIDPKRVEAYMSRGDAYVLSGETGENLAAALVDYEAAVKLDETLPEAYLGLADIYIRRGEYGKALEFLKLAEDKNVDDPRIQDKISDAQDRVFQAYRKVLDVLYYGVTRGWGDLWERGPSPEQDVALSYLWYWPYAKDEIRSLSDVGYMLIDLDKDGIPELITSVFAESWGSGDGFLYDLYTYQDGKVINLISSGERYRYYLCSDHTLWYEGSSGAEESYAGYYHINKEKTGLEEVSGSGASTVPLELTSLADYQPLTIEPAQDQAEDTESDAPQASALAPIDYLGMTVDEMANIWGHDYAMSEYWLSGCAKGLFYTDGRTPLWFYFLDEEYENKVHGDDEIVIVEYAPTEGEGLDFVAPGLSSFLTYSELTNMGYDGIIFGEGDLADMSEGIDGEKAMVSFVYAGTANVAYSWYNADPFAEPAELISISGVPSY